MTVEPATMKKQVTKSTLNKEGHLLNDIWDLLLNM